MTIFDPYNYDVVLAQFREPGEARVPAGIELSEESPQAGEERCRKNAARGPMTDLVKCNGASFEKLRKRLAQGNYGIDRAYAQVRRSGKDLKPCTLVTFVFLKGAPQAPRELEDLFAAFSRRRYEYAQASKGADHSGKPMLVLLAKTTARPAVELEKVEDRNASVYGIVITKAIRKDKRDSQAAA
jgi:hypothetical protein